MTANRGGVVCQKKKRGRPEVSKKTRGDRDDLGGGATNSSGKDERWVAITAIKRGGGEKKKLVAKQGSVKKERPRKDLTDPLNKNKKGGDEQTTQQGE